MLSLSYELSVAAFPRDKIGVDTLVRSYPAKFQINVTNDGETRLRNISVRPILQSYIGQEKPMLFTSLAPQTIEELPRKSTISLAFDIYPNFPGLVAIAIHTTDASAAIVKSKRQEERAYQELPVRWWFHVIDDISIETLGVLKDLAKQWAKKVKE